jgi:hypothetical protein
MRPRCLPSVAVAILAGLSIAEAVASPPAPLTPQQLGFVAGSREEVLTQCKRVGLIPVARPAVTGGDESAAARIESATTRALSQSGFIVVGPDTFTKAHDRFNKAVGGIYDPLLGTPRKNVNASVFSSAVREFFTQEQLGCVAYVEAVLIKAPTADNYANWDGAVEYTDGQANNTLTRVLSGNTGLGTLPAASLQLQMMNREGKMLFKRNGGVQLMSYFDRHHGSGGTDFLYVSRAKLLLDDKRIERALTFATVPFRYTPEEIAAGEKNPAINTAAIAPRDLPMPPPGSSLAEHDSPLQVPRAQILASVHRVVAGPLILNDFTPPPELAAQLRKLVHERLAPLGWEIVEHDQLNTMVFASARQKGGIYDPMTGKIDPERLHSAFRGAMQALALEPAPDAILTITLMRAMATQKNANATWDDTQQQAMTLGPVKRGPKLFGGTEDGTAGEGAMAASSLRIVLRSTDGTILYDGRGGIELLQQLSLTRQFSYPRTDFLQHLTDRAPSELFRDAERNAHAVDAALRELVMSPEQIAAAQAAAQPQKH